jgi:hypothetical protein
MIEALSVETFVELLVGVTLWSLSMSIIEKSQNSAEKRTALWRVANKIA